MAESDRCQQTRVSQRVYNCPVSSSESFPLPPPSSARGTPERNTRQRDAIRDVLADVGTPLSPKEILEHAKSKISRLGLATVYRTLKLLLDTGVVVTVEVPGEAPRFELTGKGHHHHFYCRGCSRVFEVEGCPEGLADLAPVGFTLDGHELMLIGKCNTCSGNGGVYAACARAGCGGGEKCSHHQTMPTTVQRGK